MNMIIVKIEVASLVFFLSDIIEPIKNICISFNFGFIHFW